MPQLFCGLSKPPVPIFNAFKIDMLFKKKYFSDGFEKCKDVFDFSI